MFNPKNSGTLNTSIESIILSLLNYMPYVLWCPKCLAPYVLAASRASCLACSRTSRASCFTCLWLFIFSCHTGLVLYVLSCFTCLVLFVLSYLTCFVPYVLPCLTCPSALNASHASYLAPFMPMSPFLLFFFHVSRDFFLFNSNS